jgi:oligoribonuclease (3'-5' exoribonuclease)
VSDVGALVYLDIEATGLDPLVHDVVEIAWAVEDGEVRSYVPEHSLAFADGQALTVNRYFDRDLDRRTDDTWSIQRELVRDLQGATVVGSNPAFDTMFLRRKIGYAPWHHRLVDVSNVAMMVFDWHRPKGLVDVTAALVERGLELPTPDHTATGDVECTRAVYLALRELGRAAVTS